MSQTEETMPVEVAQALLEYQRAMPESQWKSFKVAFKRARQSYSPAMALRVAEQATFKRPSSRPPA